MLGELLSVIGRIFELRQNFLKHSQKQPFWLQWPCINIFVHCEMKEILNQYKTFGEAEKFRSHIGKWLIQDRGQNFVREWVGFWKSYVIFRVGHGKCLRPITRWVGGVKKGQKHAYVIFEWSLMDTKQNWIPNFLPLSSWKFPRQKGIQ